MKKFKLDKNTSKRISTLIMAGMLVISSGITTGCSSKKEETKTNTNVTKEDKTLTNEYNNVKEGIESLLPTMNEEIVENTSLIIMLDEIAKEDENGKISVDNISVFKNKIDADNMMDDFNSFLDTLEQQMIEENKVKVTSDIVLEKDSEILSKIEKLTSNIINGDKEIVKTNFNIMYNLFVEEDKVTVDGLSFEIRELSYSGRAIAQAYARTAAYYSRNYISEKKYEKIDDRTNNQNNKAYIKQTLEILDNNMLEKSEDKIVSLFEHEYEETAANLDGKLNVSVVNIENLVNTLNLEYLNSEKVSTKDKNDVLGEYNDSKVTNTLLTIDAITRYNQENQNNLILLSSMLVDNYGKTATGKLDKVALDYIQFNTIMFLKTTNENSSFEEIFNNVYFKKLYKALTKQNLVHKYNDGSSVTINYQEISNSSKIAINEIIVYVMNQRPNIKKGKGFEDKGISNLTESIQYIQNVMTGECYKVDIEEFVKIK